MKTLEFVDTIGSWKLGGTYEDESAANTQLRILNAGNIARQYVLRDFYMKFGSIPQICYQNFDIIPLWENEGCNSFTAKVPTIMSFPDPQVNGWDSIVPMCEGAMPLTELRSQIQMRQARNHSLMSVMRSSGWFLNTGNMLEVYLKPNVNATEFPARAVLSQPQLKPKFNIDEDEYPFPDDMIQDIKAMLERSDSKRWFYQNSQVSNSKSEIENANRKL